MADAERCDINLLAEFFLPQAVTFVCTSKSSIQSRPALDSLGRLGVVRADNFLGHKAQLVVRQAPSSALDFEQNSKVWPFSLTPILGWLARHESESLTIGRARYVLWGRD